MRNIKRRMTPQPLKIRADVELTCFKYDGVLHIQVPAGVRRSQASVRVGVGLGFRAEQRREGRYECD
jgi:translation initiation factor 2 alpha subunit (eIF-2alpha)